MKHIIVKETVNTNTQIDTAIAEAKATTAKTGTTSVGIMFKKLSKAIILF
jgi:hypothetical protein